MKSGTKHDKDTSDEKKQVNNYVKYSAAGFQMIVIILVFTFIGFKIDESRHSKTPIITALLSLCGVAIALYQVIRSVNKTN